MTNPRLSMVVVSYEMRRELPRTLYSLSREYQQGSAELDYEVIVVDNGSQRPFSQGFIQSFGDNFHYRVIENPKPSPVAALNYGVSQAKGEYLGLMIDGARLLSPGMLKYGLMALQSAKRAVAQALGFHLGPQYQNDAAKLGYGKAQEDKLLKEIDWKRNGYKLFEVSVLDPCSDFGINFAPMESNCLFVSQTLFAELGGFCEGFELPGGGLANLDFFKRLCEAQDSRLFCLLGEGTFHQIHGGASDSRMFSWEDYRRDYREIRGEDYRNGFKKVEYLGHLPLEYLNVVRHSLNRLEAVRARLQSGDLAP